MFSLSLSFFWFVFARKNDREKDREQPFHAWSVCFLQLISMCQSDFMMMMMMMIVLLKLNFIFIFRFVFAALVLNSIFSLFFFLLLLVKANKSNHFRLNSFSISFSTFLARLAWLLKLIKLNKLNKLINQLQSITIDYNWKREQKANRLKQPD